MSTRKERRERMRKRLCPNCGEKGPHFAPPGFGSPGVFICEPKEGEKVERTFATEFEITHFGLTEKQAEELLDVLANQAYDFADALGLETPAIMSRQFPTEKYWEEVTDCEVHDTRGGHKGES